MKTIILKKSQSYGPYVEGSEIKAKYDLADIAVELVREYQPKLLYDIAKVGDLQSGAYGVFSTAENMHDLPPAMQDRIHQFMNSINVEFNENSLNLIPKKTLMDIFPDFDISSMSVSDTIRVNINRIISEYSNLDPLNFHYNVIREIAATIVHEATHETEFEEVGETSESGPLAAEPGIVNYIDQNADRVLEMIKNRTGITEEQYDIAQQ